MQITIFSVLRTPLDIISILSRLREILLTLRARLDNSALKQLATAEQCERRAVAM